MVLENIILSDLDDEAQEALKEDIRKEISKDSGLGMTDIDASASDLSSHMSNMPLRPVPLTSNPTRLICAPLKSNPTRLICPQASASDV